MKDKNNLEPNEYVTSISGDLIFYKPKDIWSIANNPDVCVSCKKIILKQKDLDIEIDITDKVENFDSITINGVKFVREQDE